MAKFQVHLYQDQQLVQTLKLDRPVVVTRRDRMDPPPVTVHWFEDQQRLVVADATLREIPRNWFCLSSSIPGEIQIENLRAEYPVLLAGGEEVGPKLTRTLTGEALISIGRNIALRVESIAETPSAFHWPPASDSNEFRSLSSMPIAPGATLRIDPSMSLRQFSQDDGKAAVELLRVALQVVHQATGSDAFFQSAVEAAAEIVELDRAAILLFKQASAEADVGGAFLPSGWSDVARFLDENIGESSVPPISTKVLARLVEQGVTQVHDPTHGDFSAARSLDTINCVVAAPILDRDRRVIGALYGDRWNLRLGVTGSGISDLEATLVEVLAGAVAGGIARQAEERLRSNLSEFFSPKVAQLLATHPELMQGQDAEVSVLFCDIRGFSSVTERLGAKKTIEWINDVLSELSQCVVDRDGVLVDYVGDELMAIWGAPGEQPDHASRAVDTAIAMLEAIEVLRVRWADVLPQRFGAGIGVNTGMARVGNVGSRLKFKYGVLGNTVNVGSRLQAATKQLGVDCLISEATAKAAGCTGAARRIATLSVVGIDTPTSVYQIIRNHDPAWLDFAREYERALADYESARFGEATRRLGQLMQQVVGDRPCKLLLSRAVDRLDEPNDGFSPVWVLTQK